MLVVGAGPVGLTAALLLADLGVTVTVLERQSSPSALPRAVHLDDEAVRVLHRVGISEAFLAGSRPATGLRLLDASHLVLAAFARDTGPGDNGFPLANMFHQPDLEALLLARVEDHPLVTLRRGADVVRLERVAGGAGLPVVVHALVAGSAAAFPTAAVLGCDGARSTVRDLVGITMQDLGLTERWLVVDARTGQALDAWGGVEQVCDPARAATFMRVVGDRYRWEFQLRDGESEADLEALGRLLAPWTGRTDLGGLQLVRRATYTYRAAVARRFSDGGDVFLLGDAPHLTPPFIGQGLGAGLRDAGNLAWKLAAVLVQRAPATLLTTYDGERRPHAQALVERAVLLGRAMTAGQARAARVRQAVLGVVARVPVLRSAVASPVSPRLRGLPRAPVRARSLRPGSLLPNPWVRIASGRTVRLDDVLDGVLGGVLGGVTDGVLGRVTDGVLGGGSGVLVGRVPDEALLTACRARGTVVVRVLAAGQPVWAAGWVEVALVDPPGRLAPLLRDPALRVQVRPDRVIAATGRDPHLGLIRNGGAAAR